MMTTMAATINQFSPVTPPPENQKFSFKPMPFSGPFMMPKGSTQQAPLPTPTDVSNPSRTPQPQPQTTNTEPAKQASPTPASASTSSSAQPGANLDTDPAQLAMVSRIAAYYQHRYLAITNFQQQRCQAWANMHRQKCQETMQAAMLVVAWYVRDRIRRRRRKQRTKFRQGLRGLQEKPKVTRGEVVRRWVLQVPEKTLPHDSVLMDRTQDKQEANFDLDAETPADRDTKLFDMADNLIKSQYKQIEVPLLGVLNFDESESENESTNSSHPEDEEDEEIVGGGSGSDKQGEELEDDDDDDELYDDEDLEMDSLDEQLVSDLTHNGTDSRSHMKTTSPSL